jgi:hypothetical protein
MDNLMVDSVSKVGKHEKTNIINLTGEEFKCSCGKNHDPFEHDENECTVKPFCCILNCRPKHKPYKKWLGYDNNGKSDSVNVVDGEFNDLYFNLLCEIMRRICASKQSVVEANATTPTDYYGVLDVNLVNLVNKLDPDEATNATDNTDSCCDECDTNIARSWISVETIEERDAIPKSQLADGKLVRVNNVDGKTVYYSYDEKTETWIKETIFTEDEELTNKVDVSYDSSIWEDF